MSGIDWIVHAGLAPPLSGEHLWRQMASFYDAKVSLHGKDYYLRFDTNGMPAIREALCVASVVESRGTLALRRITDARLLGLLQEYAVLRLRHPDQAAGAFAPERSAGKRHG
jgi:hypothetical protein